MSQKKRIHALVSGSVQGVGFRFFTERQAKSFGLVGEVRNRGDGRVEVTAEGNEPDLKKFIKVLESGPSLSHVSAVDVDWFESTGQFKDFSVTF